jgi:hypothetical protein
MAGDNQNNQMREKTIRRGKGGGFLYLVLGAADTGSQKNPPHNSASQLDSELNDEAD